MNNEAKKLYRELADGLSDMIESGRPTETEIIDNYEWMADKLAEIAAADPTSADPHEGLTERELKAYRVAAEDRHGREGEVEVDEDAVVSIGSDDGAYVQGWLWVDKDQVDAVLEEIE